MVEASFLLGEHEAKAASALLSALGLPRQVLPVANGGQLTLRREITRIMSEASSQSGSSSESGALPTQMGQSQATGPHGAGQST